MRFQELLALLERSKKFGFRTTTFGTKLYGHVPHVAPQAWFHSVYRGLNEEEIHNVETSLGKELPLDFKEFLQVSNGLNMYSNSLVLFGVRHSYERSGDAAWQPFSIETPNTAERPTDLSQDFTVIGGYFDDGSRLALSSKTAQVIRIPKKRGAPVLTAWGGLEEMLNSEARRLAKLFDERGKMLDEDAPTTPP